jgi:hypothetical protein
MPSRTPFDPSFDPRETAMLLRSAGTMLSSHVEEPGKVAQLDVSECREHAGNILAYARAWAEHHGYPQAADLPNSIDPDLPTAKLARLLLDASEILRTLAAAHERRSWN